MLRINYKLASSATTIGSLASLLGVAPVSAAAPCISPSDVETKISEALVLNESVMTSSTTVDAAVVRLRNAKAKEAASLKTIQSIMSGTATGSLKTARANYAKARTARIAAQTRLSNARKQLEAINLSVRASLEAEYTSYVCIDSRLLGLAASSGNGTVTVSWRSVEGATRYVLKRDGITLANTTGTNFVDTRSSNGIEHEYEVFALSGAAHEDADEQVSPVEFSNHTLLTSDTIVGQGTLPSPASLTASSTSTSVALMWSAVPNATGYQVLRNGDVIASTMATNYTDLGLASSSVFVYSVRAMQGGVLSVATPEKIAEIWAKTRSVSCARSRATVVLPVPGGPQKTSDPIEPARINRVSAPSGPTVTVVAPSRKVPGPMPAAAVASLTYGIRAWRGAEQQGQLVADLDRALLSFGQRPLTCRPQLAHGTAVWRCLLVRHPLSSWTAVRPVRACVPTLLQDEHTGWAFASPSDPPLKSTGGYGSFSCEGCVPDTVNGAKFVRDLYEIAHDTTGACGACGTRPG